MTDTTKRFNPTDKAILEATETMLHWGLTSELIAKAVEHLKGLQRLRDIERECKAAEIQAAIRKQAQPEALTYPARDCILTGDRVTVNTEHEPSKCILPSGHTSPCVIPEHVNAYQRAANAMSKPEPKS